MTDLPPPPSPPPPSSYQPAPPPPAAVLGTPRYRVLPFVIPLTAAMVATLVTRVIVAARSGDRGDAARQFLAGTIEESEFRARLAATNGISNVSTIAMNVVIVLTVIVMYRMLSNLRAMGRDTAWSPVWAIFGWILPPGIWVIPALFTAEAWKASSPTHDWRRQRTPLLVWLWVLVYAAGTVVGVVAGISQMMAAFDIESVTGASTILDQAEAIADNLALANVGEALIIVAGILWAVVIGQLARRHARFTGEQRARA